MKARKIRADEQKKHEPPRGFLKKFRPDFARVHLLILLCWLAFHPDDKDVPLVVRREIVAASGSVAGDREKRGRRGFGRHHAGRVGDGLRVNPLFEPDREVLGLVIDRALRRVFEVDAEDESVLLFEPPHVADDHPEIVVVVRGAGRGMEDASQRVRVVLLEKRIRFRLVQKRKQPLGNNGPRGGASAAALERTSPSKRASRKPRDAGRRLFC